MSEPGNNNRNLWFLVIALLAVVAIIFVLNPTRGDDEAQLEAAVDEAQIDRDDTLQDYPVEADPYTQGEEGDVTLDIPASEETGVLGSEMEGVTTE